MSRRLARILSVTFLLGTAGNAPAQSSFTNPIGMEFVRIEPGTMVLTLMPASPTSPARLCMKPMRPNLEAL